MLIPKKGEFFRVTYPVGAKSPVSQGIYWIQEVSSNGIVDFISMSDGSISILCWYRWDEFPLVMKEKVTEFEAIAYGIQWCLLGINGLKEKHKDSE